MYYFCSMDSTIGYQQLKEIAESLDCGLICYYHMPTGNIEAWPEGDEGENEYLDEAMATIDENYSEYLRIPPPEPQEAFEMMEDFIATLPLKTVQEHLYQAIRRHKPFQEFKAALLDYPDIREQWFQYKLQQLMKYAAAYFLQGDK